MNVRIYWQSLEQEERNNVSLALDWLSFRFVSSMEATVI